MSAWTVLSLPPVLWQRPWPKVSLRPLDITIDESSINSGHACGQTLWHFQQGDGLAAIGWEWVQVRRGFLAMSDPMNIVSNLRIVDDENCAVSDSQRLIVLNTMVHATAWQGEVLRRLRECQRGLGVRRQALALAA